MKKKKKKVMIVMPAYNASKTLEATYHQIPKDFVDEIVLVDDFSRDKTVKIAKKLPITVITHNKNRGYGGNQKTCYNYALKQKADIIVMVHPDNQYDPRIINELILPIMEGHTDVVFASRFIRNPIEGGPLKGGMPLYKYLANRFLTTLENQFLGTYFSEFHTGYRAYSGKVLSKIPYWTNSDDFVFDNEIIVQLILAKARFKEIAVKTKYFKEASSINFIRSLQYGLGILTLLLKYTLFKFKILNFPQFDLNDEKKSNNRRNKNTITINQCPKCHSKNRHIEMHGFPKWEGDIYKCEQCGLYYYDRHPKSVKTYYKILYKQKNSTRFNKILQLWIKWLRYKRIIFINKFYSLKNKGNILNIGIEPEISLNSFKKKGWVVYETKINTKKHANNDSKKVIDLEEFLNIKYKKNSFSVITVFHVLEYIKNPFAYITKIYNLLKPNGIFVLEVPNFEHILRFSYGSRWAALDIPNHLYHFDRDWLKKFLTDLGFKIEFESSFSFEFSIFNVVQSWLNLWHKKYNVFIRELLPMKLHKMLFSKLFYKELFLIIIGTPVILYQILKLKLHKNNGDTLRLVVRKK